MYGPGFRSYFEYALLRALYECFGIVGCLLSRSQISPYVVSWVGVEATQGFHDYIAIYNLYSSSFLAQIFM